MTMTNKDFPLVINNIEIEPSSVLELLVKHQSDSKQLLNPDMLDRLSRCNNEIQFNNSLDIPHPINIHIVGSHDQLDETGIVYYYPGLNDMSTEEISLLSSLVVRALKARSNVPSIISYISEDLPISTRPTSEELRLLLLDKGINTLNVTKGLIISKGDNVKGLNTTINRAIVMHALSVYTHHSWGPLLRQLTSNGYLVNHNLTSTHIYMEDSTGTFSYKTSSLIEGVTKELVDIFGSRYISKRYTGKYQ